MSHLYYFELELHNIRPEGYKTLLAVVKSYFVCGYNPDYKPTAKVHTAAFTGWHDVNARLSDVHLDIQRAIQTALPDARVKTRWFDWEPVVWDAEFDSDTDENEEADE